MCSALAWLLADRTGLNIDGASVAVLGALPGVMAAPAVRLPLERRDAAGHGFLIILAGMLLIAALVTAMGLAVMAAVTSAGCAAHAVQVRPTRRQVVSSRALAAVTAAAALGAQLAGWVDGIIDPSPTAVVMGGLLIVMCPQVLNAASMGLLHERVTPDL